MAPHPIGEPLLRGDSVGCSRHPPGPRPPWSPRQQRQAVSHLSPLWTSGKVCLCGGVHLLLSGSGGKGWYFLGRVTGGLWEESQQGTEKVCLHRRLLRPRVPTALPSGSPALGRRRPFLGVDTLQGWPSPSRGLCVSDSQSSREPEPAPCMVLLAWLLFPDVICYRLSFVPRRATTCSGCRRPGDKL